VPEAHPHYKGRLKIYLADFPEISSPRSVHGRPDVDDPAEQHQPKQQSNDEMTDRSSDPAQQQLAEAGHEEREDRRQASTGGGGRSSIVDVDVSHRTSLFG